MSLPAFLNQHKVNPGSLPILQGKGSRNPLPWLKLSARGCSNVVSAEDTFSSILLPSLNKFGLVFLFFSALLLLSLPHRSCYRKHFPLKIFLREASMDTDTSHEHTLNHKHTHKIPPFYYGTWYFFWMCKYHMDMTKRERNTNAEIDTESCHLQYSFIPWIAKIQKVWVCFFLH